MTIRSDAELAGMQLMVSARPAHVVTEMNRWTLRTHDRALAAHRERSIVMRRRAPLVLTAD